MGGEFGGEWVHVHVWLSPFVVHLRLSQHCLVGYTPIQNKTFFFFFLKCVIQFSTTKISLEFRFLFHCSGLVFSLHIYIGNFHLFSVTFVLKETGSLFFLRSEENQLPGQVSCL